MGNVDNEGGWACVRQGEYRKYLSFYQIFCETKTALKL